jgi:beta-barrel assembly-enhancing protease
MLDFFKIMRRYEFYSNSVPSYFLTHPGTDERIRYLDAMIQTTYTRRGEDSIVGNLKRIQTLVLLKSRDYHGNLKHFQNNLGKNPNDVDDLFGLGVTCERLGQTSEAFQSFHKAHVLSPSDPDILREMGIAYYNAGKAKEAIGYLQETIKHDPDNAISLLYLARSYEAVGENVQAIALFKEIEGKNIVDDEVYYTMAMIYGRTDHPYESHYYFGQYFKRKLKKESALFHYQAALKYVSPNGPEAEKIQKEILSLKKTVGNTGSRPPSK